MFYIIDRMNRKKGPPKNRFFITYDIPKHKLGFGFSE